MRKLNVKKIVFFTVVFLIMLVSFVYGAMNNNKNSEHKSESLSTSVITSNPSPADLNNDPFDNYFSYLDDMLSEKYKINDLLLNEQDHIKISFSDDLDKREIKFVKAIMDTLDDVFQIYENREIIIVELEYDGGSEVFDIYKTSTEDSSSQEPIEIQVN